MADRQRMVSNSRSFGFVQNNEMVKSKTTLGVGISSHQGFNGKGKVVEYYRFYQKLWKTTQINLTGLGFYMNNEHGQTG